MSDTTFRIGSVEPPVTSPDPVEPFVENKLGYETSLGDEEPVEAAKAPETVLSLLGVDDATGMPEEDSANLKEVTDYILDMVDKRGATPTQSSMKRALDSIKEELDLDPEAEPGAILNRVGGLVKAWKGLTFIREPSERRRLFMKLARLPDSKSIDNAVMEEMEKRRVWQR